MESKVDHELEITVFDAGRGDCIRVRFRGKSGGYRNILVDSGTGRFGERYREIVQSIERTGEHLDLQIITHTDEDHLGGLLYMAKRNLSVQAGLFVMNQPSVAMVSNGGNTPLSVMQAKTIFCRIGSQKMNFRSGLKGEKIELDGALLEILHPEQHLVKKAFDSVHPNVPLQALNNRNCSLEQLMEQPLPPEDGSLSNRASVVFVLEYGGKRLLFTGDAWSSDLLEGVRRYAAMKEERLPIFFDAVKLPHHGSARNISEQWPEVLESRRYILCADGRRHPDKQTVAKLVKWYSKIEIFSARCWWSDGFFSVSDQEHWIDPGYLRLNMTKESVIL